MMVSLGSSMSDFWSQFVPQSSATQADTRLYPIMDQAILTVEGPDSAKFMQGQFTCNLNEVSPASFRRGACCSPKGRMITSFSLAQSDENTYQIAMDATVIDGTQAHLKKYMVFFKTSMQQHQWIQAGLKGPQAQAILGRYFDHVPIEDFGQEVIQQGLILKLPFDAGYELWLKPEFAEPTLTALNTECPLMTENGWQQNRIVHGLGYVTANSQGELIPQMMNLAQTGGVSFNKGCYTGQEIVARMQYLGKLKRHMYRFSIQCESPIQGFAPIYTSGKESPIGHVLNSAQIAPGHHDALIVLEDKHLSDTHSLSLGQSSALKLLDLPYEVVPAQDS